MVKQSDATYKSGKLAVNLGYSIDIQYGYQS